MTAPTPSAVFLVSGGARGITAQCAIEAARAFRCKFILLGRSAQAAEPAWAASATTEAELKAAAAADLRARGDKPSPAAVSRIVNAVLAGREIAGTLDAIRATGGEAVYLSADITNLDALRTALATAAHLGPITGIIHGAGNLADKLIEHKTEADYETVYSAKVAGLANLLTVVPPAGLQHLVLFSSVAGFYGNSGQADYALANEILNKTAQQLQRQYPACHVVAIDWGPWDGGMVTPQLRAYFDSLDIRVIPVDVGARMLVDELRAGAAAPQIVIGSAIRPQPTAPTGDLATHTLRRVLRLADNPFLADHVVNGKAVLPMVSAMSWMASACEGLYPGYRHFMFENYRVLKGIVFDETLAPEYTLELKEVSKDAEALVIDALVRSHNAEGKPRFHYSTRLTLRAVIPPAPPFQPPTIPSGTSPLPGAQFYEDGTLFHRYSFRGVEQVLHIDEHGVSMRCTLPPTDADYQGQFPVQAFNYAMADIGLQSIGIWARRQYGTGSLPLRAARGQHFADGTFGQSFLVAMTVRMHNSTNVIAGITVYDETGRVYMIIDDLEMTLSASLNELFLRNTLTATAS